MSEQASKIVWKDVPKQTKTAFLRHNTEPFLYATSENGLTTVINNLEKQNNFKKVTVNEKCLFCVITLRPWGFCSAIYVMSFIFFFWDFGGLTFYKLTGENFQSVKLWGKSDILGITQFIMC